MRRNLRHFIVGTTASLLIVGCGLTTAQKSEEKKKSEDAKSLSAGATVNNQQFSLSLPYLPDVKPGTVMKAHLRIFDSQVALPGSVADCPEPDTSVYSKPKKNPEPQSDQKLKGLGLTQRPVKTVYEDSLEYKAGASIGPIMLDQGAFTAVLDIYDERGRRYTGTSWFDVKQKAISEIVMEMQVINDCEGGSGGVVITPIIPGQSDDLVSACEFMTMEPALCRPEEAVCYYGGHKGYSTCGVRQARQSLIGTLCKLEVKVPKSFESEILCESMASPEPEPQPPKPADPVSNVRSCIQMDMPCDASDQLVGKGCSARYHDPKGELEQKLPLVITGNYCKDRFQTLSALCEKGIQKYKLQCSK